MGSQRARKGLIGMKMDRRQAKQIIKDTFESSFDKNRFEWFIKNLLNRIDLAPVTYKGNYIPDTYKQYIKTLERIGKFNDGENNIDILVITLRKNTSLERARTMQRNFAAWYLNGSRGGIMKDAALAAFVAPDKADWRFSLVKMDYKFEQTLTGEIKVKEEFTPARRWSFLVGVNEKSHTAQSRLVPILADDENDPTLAEIEKAFDIETVTKEFFIKYRSLFLRTKEELDKVVEINPEIKTEFNGKGINTVNFAKKLLGQIIFLYFLQKKGWFGVPRDLSWGKGSKRFLRELFDKKHGDYNNFFNDILEPLFYDALSRDRSDIDHWNDQFKCKIPFLNGGLFDPIGNYSWYNTDILLPNSLFSNKDENNYGDGILDIFDLYNFTVKEDEPLEKEVAIDPELLGKAYEKFNAIRPDNYDEFKKSLKTSKKGDETKFNKKYGVYYTPREIVNYMCRESLIYYLSNELEKANTGAAVSRDDIETFIHIGEQLSENEATALIKEQNIKEGKQKTARYKLKLPESIRRNAELIDRKLKSITVCDPAAGSGAFPVGIMSEIVRARTALNPFIEDHENRNAYYFKRYCIEHSLYGVDIDPGAVEIAKLRLWLSLVVDEEDIKTIKPLPNLDYRIMQGNSLISNFMGIRFDSDNENKNVDMLFRDKIDELIEQFNRKKDEFLDESTVSKKSKLKEEVEDLLVKIFEAKLKTQKADYLNRLKNIVNTVLVNKPKRDEYIRQEKEKLYRESGFDLESAEKEFKELIGSRKIKQFFLWKLYFSEVFHEKGGFDIVIANPPYIQLQKMRGDPLQKAYKDENYETHESTGDLYCLFYEQGINLLKPEGHLVFITSNKWMRAGYGKKLRSYFAKYNPLILIDMGPGVFETATVDTSILIIQNQKNRNALKAAAYSKTDKSLTEYFKQNAIKLRNPGNDAWFIGSEAEHKLKEKIERIGKPLKEWDVNINYGIKTGFNEAFIIDTPTKERLCREDPKSAEIIKPILRGRDVKRYSYEWAGLWLIATRFDIDIPKLYPAVFKHLLQFKDKAKKRDDQGQNWWNLRACAYYSEFEKEKVVWPMVSTGNCVFSLIGSEYYLNNKVYLITGKHLRYLLGILNSNIAWYLFKNKEAGLGNNSFEIRKEGVNTFPIPAVTTGKHSIIENIELLVDKILAEKKSGKKTESLEKEIDQLVYKLYKLTPDEIKIIEVENGR